MPTDRRPRAPLVAERRNGAAARTTRPAARKPARQRRRPPSGNILVRLTVGLVNLVWRVLWGTVWRATMVVILILGLATGYYYTTLPPLTELLDGRSRGSVTMLDSDGQVFAWRGETFGGQITAADVSPHLRNAIIATEDRRFYSHFGLSPRGIAGAIRSNIADGRGAFSGAGGSTITQQTAKLLCLGVPFDRAQWPNEAAYEADCRRSTVWRKIQEVPYALALEARYSKDDILTIYLNRAYLGAGARGFEAAAQRYFGKSANLVTPAEAAMLAGLLIAPSRFAPTRNLERAQGRANVILGLMAREGFLTDAQLAEARANPAQLSEAAERRAGGYFADWVMEAGPSFLTRNTTEDVIIATTLDQRVQRAAEEALVHVFETRVREGSNAQAAIVVMSPDGAVRAMVGGRRIQSAGGFNRATQALRQTGSAFKPFIYAIAMEMGYQPTDLVEDTPLTIQIPGSGPWSPQNYTRDFAGIMTLQEAFAQSRNIPAVRISEALGRENVRRTAAAFGVRSSLADGPAIALGVSESTLIEMTAAMAGILNGGRAVAPFGVVELRLTGDSEPLIGMTGGMGEQVIGEDAAAKLIQMMRAVIDEGTGRRAALPGREAAGKTGTTQAARDAWFLGFTADYVAGVWMGYDDNTPLTGVQGGGLPAEIWRETMVRVHAGLPARALPRPAPQPVAPAAPMAEPQLYGAPPATDGGSAIDRAIREALGSIFGN